MVKYLFLLGLLFTFVSSTQAKIIAEAVDYKEGEAVLEGYLAYDDAIKEKRPAVIIVHAWKGLGDYEKSRARQLAEMGYVAFAVDIYGKGIRAKDAGEARELATQYRSGDRKNLRARVNAGLDYIKKHKLVNPQKIAAIGYCFGGTTVLELARSGANIQGVVSFHGGLSSVNPDDAKNIKCKILACHGADDPNVNPDEVLAFQEEMRNARVDWYLVAYGNAVHSFTEVAAGNDNSRGVAYNEKADKRSWQAMKDFFNEIF